MRRRAVAAAAFGLMGVAFALRGQSAGHAVFVAQPLTPVLRDLAVDCLAAGTVRPAVAELAELDLEALVEIVGRLLDAYGNGDFDSFLALHSGDLAHADERRAGDVQALRAFGRELAPSAARVEEGWSVSLRAFWSAYYERPAVARFLPEHTRVELHAEGLGARSLASWRESFVALRDRAPGAWIQHELCVPHRRSLEQVARDSGPLRWLDLELHFETHAGLAARLLTRFVWDGVALEWFLQDAATIYAARDRSQRHLIL